MISGQNAKKMKCQVDEKPSRQDDKLIKMTG